MKKVFLNCMLLLCALIVGSGSLWATDPSVTFTFSDIASANSWTNGTAYTSVVNSPITIVAQGGGNNGKWYTSGGGSWRMYSGGTVSITAATGYEVKSVSSSPSCSFTVSKGVATFSPSARTDFTVITVTYSTSGGSSAVATTTTISATGITNTNVYAGTAAGSLSAAVTVTEGGAAVGGATVTWSGDNDEVATINASTGAVTLVAAGTVTFTATYAGVENEYESSSDTYEMTVTNVNPNLLTIWSENFSGYAADAVPTGGTYGYVCVDGGSDTKIYSANLAGGSSPELLVGKSTGSFTATIPLDKYYGNLTLSYKTNAKSMTISTTTTGLGTSGTTSFSTLGTHEVTFTGVTASTTSITIVFTPGSDNVRLDDIELKGSMAAPQFSVPEGSVIAGTKVSLSATAGATIYYTTDGNTPTSESTAYSSAITIDADVTIKAIAIKGGKSSSVGTAAYTIETDPFISLSTTSVAATKAETDGTITVTYNNLTEYVADLEWYEADGTTPATYDWLDAEINSSTKNVDYEIGENDTYSSRTAYLKVYAVGDEGDVYSDLITIAQAGKTVDFATLPFSFDGGKNSLPTGLTQSELGSDYASSPNLKFDNTDDNVVLKINEAPGELKFDIKGNTGGGAWTGTFKVQTSADGSIYSDLAVYTDNLSTSKETKTMTMSSDVRYIKWILTDRKANVALGNIKLTGCESVSVGEAGYTTYVTTGKVSFPTGVTGYIATATSGSAVTLVSKESVPASTPIVLKADEGTYYLPVITTAPDDVDGNILQASDGSVTGDASTIYALGVGKNGENKGKVGFFLVNTDVTVPAGKAYLTYSGSDPAPSMIRIEDEVEVITNIENIEANEKTVKFIENGRILIKKNGIVYDTMGRIIR